MSVTVHHGDCRRLEQQQLTLPAPPEQPPDPLDIPDFLRRA